MKVSKIIASGLGTGFAPIAPGTVGSILGIFLWWILNYLLTGFNIDFRNILLLNLLAIIVILIVGVFSIKNVHKQWEHDAPEIVIDEIVGVWIAALALPFDRLYYLYALILFRFFDIAKPLFIRKFDNMKNNWSVMLDDVLAGIYSFVLIQILLYFKII